MIGVFGKEVESPYIYREKVKIFARTAHGTKSGWITLCVKRDAFKLGFKLGKCSNKPWYAVFVAHT